MANLDNLMDRLDLAERAFGYAMQAYGRKEMQEASTMEITEALEKVMALRKELEQIKQLIRKCV